MEDSGTDRALTSSIASVKVWLRRSTWAVVTGRGTFGAVLRRLVSSVEY